MNKREFNRVVAGIGFLVALVCGSVCHAAPVVEKPDLALRKAFPNLPFESVEQTDIKGMYEVISGSNIYYYFPEKDYLFVGEIYNPSGKSLTEEKKAEITAKLMKNLPLDKAVKIGKGNTVVVEFTDPDCPYCRRAYEFLKSRTDISIYVFFSPFAHPAAISKVYYILNAVDKEKAYNEMFDGKSPVEPAAGYSDAIKTLAQEHLNIARSAGVAGTPTFFINGKLVVGADIPQMEKLLNDAASSTKKIN
jgi:thiol:disulfide interchange protein DsbC